MAPSFKDSGRYQQVHRTPNGPGDARPTALQIVQDNDLVGKLEDETILITGGSSGLGIEEVRALAMTGAAVIFTSRDPAKGEAVRKEILDNWKESSVKPNIGILTMDMQSLESVRKAAEEFKNKHDKLHVLVNNAGIGLTPHGLTADGYEQQFGVNHLAHFYLFQLLKPLLMAASTPTFNSRVISVASSIHQMASVKVGDYNFERCDYDPFAAYASSKTCNIWMANEIERRYGSKGLHSISVHPGGIRTGFQRHHDEKALQMIEAMIQQEHIAKAFKNAGQGAASIVLSAVGNEYEGVGGLYMEDCGVSPKFEGRLGDPGYMPWAYDEDGAKQLWLDSLEMLKMKNE